MNSASFSTIAAHVDLDGGRAKRLRSAGRSLLGRRGIGELTGVLSGSAFLLARVPVYALVLLFAAIASLTGVLLYGLTALVRRVTSGTADLEVAETTIAQMPAGGSTHG
jgi:hypothetical protein